MKIPSLIVCLLTLFGCLLSTPIGATADEPPAKKEDAQDQAHPLGEPKGAKRLSPEHDVWVDAKKKQVILDGEICLRKGLLEMFACLDGTKEHESIVAVKTKAYMVHAALLSVGAEAGSPVKFHPEYVPAKGTEVEIDVIWVDKKGKHHIAKAQEWIQNVKTKKAMSYNWVFAGSGFWTDEQTGKKYYQAEGGDLICVSNFSSALLDLPVESPQANQGLLFQAFTEHIPPLKTKVRLILKPQVAKKAAEKKPADAPEKPAQNGEN